MAKPTVAVVMGSNSDWPIMKLAAEYLEKFGIEFEARVVSAHRTPDLLTEFGKTAADRGIACIIAGAGGADALTRHAGREYHATGAGCASAYRASTGAGLSLFDRADAQGNTRGNICDRKAGAINAALFAVSILANSDPALAQKLEDFRTQQATQCSK